MARIEWSQELSVGHEVLDKQHKLLIDHYNQLHESLLNDSPEETGHTKKRVLAAMVAYALEHFEAEESYMQRLGYTGLEEHRRAHRDFREKIFSLNRDVQEDRVVLSTSVMKILRNWITDHLAGEDQEYRNVAVRK
jgi:hemerythrin-like metal-binding protein